MTFCFFLLFFLPGSPGWGSGRAATPNASSPGTWRAPWKPVIWHWGWRHTPQTQRCCSWVWGKRGGETEDGEVGGPGANRQKCQGEKEINVKRTQRPNKKSLVKIRLVFIGLPLNACIAPINQRGGWLLDYKSTNGTQFRKFLARLIKRQHLRAWNRALTFRAVAFNKYQSSSPPAEERVKNESIKSQFKLRDRGQCELQSNAAVH